MNKEDAANIRLGRLVGELLLKTAEASEVPHLYQRIAELEAENATIKASAALAPLEPS